MGNISPPLSPHMKIVNTVFRCSVPIHSTRQCENNNKHVPKNETSNKHNERLLKTLTMTSA